MLGLGAVATLYWVDSNRPLTGIVLVSEDSPDGRGPTLAAREPFAELLRMAGFQRSRRSRRRRISRNLCCQRLQRRQSNTRRKSREARMSPSLADVPIFCGKTRVQSQAVVTHGALQNCFVQISIKNPRSTAAKKSRLSRKIIYTGLDRKIKLFFYE